MAGKLFHIFQLRNSILMILFNITPEKAIRIASFTGCGGDEVGRNTEKGQRNLPIALQAGTAEFCMRENRSIW